MYTILIIFIELYLILSLVARNTHLLEKMIGTILMGLGIFGYVAFMMREYLGIGYNLSPTYISISLFAVLLILSFIKIKQDGLNVFLHNFSFQKLSKVEILFILISLVAIIRGFYVPVRGWDAYSLYDARARFYEDGLRQSDLKTLTDYDEANNQYYFSYPPMTSSIHAVLYSAGFQSPTFIYVMLYFSLIAMVYMIVKTNKLSPFYAFLILVPVAFNRLMMGQVYSSYTNLPMISFQVASVYFAIKYFRSNQNLFIIMSSIMLGFANWTRSLEPTYISFLIFSLFLILTNKSFSKLNKLIVTISYVALSIIPRFIWSSYVLKYSGVLSDIAPSFSKLIYSLSDALYLNNLFEVAFFVYRSLFSMQNYILLFVAIVIFIPFIKIQKRTDKILTYSLIILVLSLYLIMVAGTVYFSVTFIWWKEIPGSFLRSNLVLIPLIMIITAMIFKQKKYAKK